MIEHNPEYAWRAELYQPTPENLAKVAAVAGELRLRIYFGSWCSVCEQYMPRIVSLVEALEEKPKLEYYGLPEDHDSDPELERLGL